MDRLIIVLIVILAVVAIAQLLRVYELGSKLKGNREEDISLRDNKLNANLWLIFMVVFYAFVIWLIAEYGGNNFGKGIPASDVGEKTDWLLLINFLIITAVFFLTNTVLFVFSWKYYYRKDRKAYYYPHNNKLELLWTVVPAIVLAVIIILGLRTWFEVTDMTEKEDDGIVMVDENIELFAKQFDWFVRYGGEDNQLGQSDYKLITSQNQVGVVTAANIDSSLSWMDSEISKMAAKLNNEGAYLPDWQYDELESKIIRMNRLSRRLYTLGSQLQLDKERDSTDWDEIGGNDVVTNDTVFLVKNRRYKITIRSKDVIHSAYFPHFRQQMNAVPGATTFMRFKPLYTTEEMRKEMNDPNFDYWLVCNKICGGSHSNMVKIVYVGTEEEFRAWISRKNRVDGKKYDFIEYDRAKWDGLNEKGPLILPIRNVAPVEPAVIDTAVNVEPADTAVMDSLH